MIILQSKPTSKMMNLFVFLSVLLRTFYALHPVQAQDPVGFISLDCGLPDIDSGYKDSTTSLTYITDANFIDTGTSKIIKINDTTHSLRSFPEGYRNCYNMNLNIDYYKHYLIRASFLYGNYDGLNELPSFDLYIGPNLWTSVKIEYADTLQIIEILHVLPSEFLQVCLVKTGTTTPFISKLELRPLYVYTYITQFGSLVTFKRYHFNNNGRSIRFKDEASDRVWSPFFDETWSQIETSSIIDSTNIFDLSQLSMNAAATPIESSLPMNLTFQLPDPTSQLYVYMHFAELEVLKANESREFNITCNGDLFFGPFVPNYLSLNTIFSYVQLSPLGGKYEFILEKTKNSSHAPMINAIEVYRLVEFLQGDTNQTDFNSIMNIKTEYGVNRITWQGDPCAPRDYMWAGLNCSYPDYRPPRITSLNLSSSGLTGEISIYISNLTQLTSLDLSNNYLTGNVPEYLTNLTQLRVLNLSGNQLNGTIPAGLLENKRKGKLTLSMKRNPLCTADLCNDTKDPRNQTRESKSNHRASIVVGVSCACVFLVVAGFVTILIFRCRKSSKEKETDNGLPLMIKNRRVISSEVLKMTNNFERAIGKGGYGTVYHGYLNNAQVAVKILSETSVQGYKEFKAEVELLLRVHHTNLVTLVGYCDKGDNLALVYEYMANGNLKEHLLGKDGCSILNWEDKLRIASNAAQGLEYLHTACKPPIVHRDVKTTNILLDENLQAKMGDFGLSRSLSMEGETHVSTLVAGTPGYLDPEYHRTNWLTEKSDVYSFGIVLLEIVTNQHVIDKTRSKFHIIEWVEDNFSEGDIKNIIDPNLKGSFDFDSVSRLIELAMTCVNPSSYKRPTMTHVVQVINTCLETEIARKGGYSEIETQDHSGVSTTFNDYSDLRAR